MYSVRIGQTQVFTAVLLGGILMAAVSGAYVWGLPILQKNQDVNNAQESLADLKDLSRAISTVATGGGSRSVTVNLADGTLNVNETHDFITYTTVTKGAYVSSRVWVPLNENDMQGIDRDTGLPDDGYGVRGADDPSLLIGKAEQSANGYTTRYRIVIRDLLDTNTGQTYRVDLVRDGNLEASNGQHTVVLRSGTEETETGTGIDGGTLQTQNLLMRVS